MANQPKRININSSTLVDLKAELLRKQQEFRKEKSRAGLPPSQKKTRNEKEKGSSIWSKANAGVLERAQQDIEAKKEEDATLEKSRTTLEAKAKLYEKITQSNDIPEDDDGELFLVDFQRKALNDRLQERLEERAKEEKLEKEEADKRLNEPVPEAEKPEEEWIDYVDQYGKSRKCLRKDLEDLKGQVKPLKINGESELLSEDMKRELMRQKWEQEEENMLQGPVHYSNVQFDEVRSHGVAYYQFSKDQEERKSQMERLQQLREQTLEQREKKEKLIEKRKALMTTRLAKVKQRRMITSTIDSDSDEKEEEAEVKKEVKVAEPIIRDDSWRKNVPVREWDKGKKADMDWVQHNRADRNDDFAPPSLYFEPSSSKVTSRRPTTEPSRRPTTEPSRWPTTEPSRLPTTEPIIHKNQMPPNVNKIELQVDSLLSHIRSEPEPDAPFHENNDVADIPLPQESHSVEQNQDKHHESAQKTYSHDSFVPLQAAPPPAVFYPNQWTVPPVGCSDEQMTFESLGYSYYPYPDELQNMNSGNQNAISSHEPCHATHEVTDNLSLQCSELDPPGIDSSKVTVQDDSSDQPKDTTMKNGQATYSSQPVRYARPGIDLVGQQDDGTIVAPAPLKSTYHRVNLHEVPRSLPKPPSLANKPSYPSQDNVGATSEKKAEKNWMKQFGAPQKQGHDDKTPIPKTDKIPFPSPYVQKSDVTVQPFKSDVQFDPSKPPPSISGE